MSLILMDIPILQVNNNDLENLIRFIYKHEHLLHEFGAIKIQLNADCKLALKKRRKNLLSFPTREQIVKLKEDESIYMVQKMNDIDDSFHQYSLIRDELDFWYSLSCSNNIKRQLNSSTIYNKSFFSRKKSRAYFDIHRLPRQSALKLGGTKVTHQFVPCVQRAHGSGSIFPLSSVQHRLFSIHYHHEGGAHHWYIIPNHQRENLRKIIDQQNSSLCLDHGQLFIDPSILDKNHIGYHRIVQFPNEFVVLSSGTLVQCFTEDASWSESISFALPSWIEQVNQIRSFPLCQCNISSQTIDIKLFKHHLIEKYIASHLNIVTDNKSSTTGDDDTVNLIPLSTANSNETQKLDAATILSTNRKLIVRLQPIIPCLPSPSSSSILSSTVSYSPKENHQKSDDNDVYNQYNRSNSTYAQLESPPSTVYSVSESEMMIIDQQLANSCLSSLFMMDSEQATFNYLTEPFTPSFETQSSEDFEYFFNTILSSSPLMASSEITSDQIEELNDDITAPSSSKLLQPPISNTIILSCLPVTVNSRRLRALFPRCRKIILKKNQWNKNFRFALIEHRNCIDAERNLSAFLKSSSSTTIFSSVYASYARTSTAKSKSKLISKPSASTNVGELYVGRIPGTVNHAQLQQLFPQAISIRYRQGKVTGNRVRLGFAFLQLSDTLSATQIIEHADQYYIDNQPLSISYAK